MEQKSTSIGLRTVLLLQGGGALGAYQAGVFEALDRSGLAPDWAVGTSIGAINAALIAGNRPHRRLEHLYEFWARVGQRWAGFDALPSGTFAPFEGLTGLMQSARTMAFGIPHFFRPRWPGPFAFGLPTDPAQASFYDVQALRHTLLELVDFDYLTHSDTRLSVGAVDIETAEITYFDSRSTRLSVKHILASCALPPAFAPVEIEGRHYWDGGIHSNTPLEWILRDPPRLDSLCFLATLWPAHDTVPNTLTDVMRRAKEIRFASRARTLIDLEQELHRLRHYVAMLADRLPDDQKDRPDVTEMRSFGCRSVFHLVRLEAPKLQHEREDKDIDFAPERVGMRWSAGCHDGLRVLAERAWAHPVDVDTGIVIHDYTQPEPDTTGTDPPTRRQAQAEQDPRQPATPTITD
ncbi:patatin-like phospholipase family protein [Rhodocyclaceae bacterium SMB388]